MVDRPLNFRITQEQELGSIGENKFLDGAITLGYNSNINSMPDGRLYIDLLINNTNYRLPINSDCSYFLIKDGGTLYGQYDADKGEVPNTTVPVSFVNGVPQEVNSQISFLVEGEGWYDSYGRKET